MKYPKPRFNGVAVRIWGARLWHEQDEQGQFHLHGQSLSRGKHTHMVFHAAYTTPAGQSLLSDLWDAAGYWADNPNVRMIVNTHKGRTT